MKVFMQNLKDKTNLFILFFQGSLKKILICFGRIIDRKKFDQIEMWNLKSWPS